MNFKQSIYIFLIICLMLMVITNNSSSKTILKGVLLGFDSKPMIKSHVLVKPLNKYDSSSILIECDRDGNFIIDIQDSGFIFIRFSGVNHQPCEIPIYTSSTQDSISFICKLIPNSIDTNNKVFITGNFNDFKFYDNNYLMKKNLNGKYSIDINTSIDTLIYQIINQGNNYNHSINGTLNNYYQIDNEGDYYSVFIQANRNKTIIFNPVYYIFHNAKYKTPEIVVLNNAQLQDFINLCLDNKIYLSPNDRLNYFLEDTTLKNSSFLSLFTSKKVSNIIQRKIDNLDSLIKINKIENERIILFMEYFNYLALAKILMDAKILGLISFVSINVNLDVLKQGLNLISPTSMLWITKLNRGPDIPFLCSIIVEGTDSSDYIEQLVSDHPVVSFRLEVLKKGFNYYNELNLNKNRKKYFLGRLLSEYPYDNDVQVMKLIYSENNRIKTNKKIPDFEIKDIESNRIITNIDLFGKYTLLDFWSTYCSPCISEFAFFNDAFKKYKDKNFQIITISFDKDIKKVKAFLSKKNIPWTNAFETDGFTSEIAKKFEVIGLPKPLLINKDGIIIAEGHEIRGKNLLKKLESIFDVE